MDLIKRGAGWICWKFSCDCGWRSEMTVHPSASIVTCPKCESRYRQSHIGPEWELNKLSQSEADASEVMKN